MNREQRTAYLKRIGIKGELPVNRDTLEKLLQAHLEQVPFENLDVYDFKKVPSLEADALFDKVVTRHRGGFCFELNTLFARLLESLGFKVYPVAVRVLWNKDSLPPLAHMALIVCLGKEKYFCDVGYGGPPQRAYASGRKRPQGQRRDLSHDLCGGRYPDRPALS